MKEYNLKEFFKASHVDISDLLLESNILSLHILHLYYIIKDWYIYKKSRKIKLYKDIIENKDYINNNIETINIQNLTNSGYCSIIYNESSIISHIKHKSCLEYIQTMYEENEFYYAIYIRNKQDIYIVFNYDFYKKILLIDVYNLEIREFKSIIDCIEQINIITQNNYNYQILRIVKRPYSFDENKCYIENVPKNT